MTSNTAFSFDVTEEDFSNKVVEASYQQPVLVDFWATWCGPCQTLMPLLMQLADAYEGKFLLAKVEIDQQQGLASHFGVRSVPTVKLIKNGQVVDEFMGALPESQIRAFLDRHIERESDQLMQQALMRYQQGDREQALVDMQAIVSADPANDQNKILLLQALMSENRFAEAQSLVDGFPTDLQDTDEVNALKARLQFAAIVENAADMANLSNTVVEQPDDCEARYQLSAHHLMKGDYDAGMEQLLEIVRRDRTFKDDAGRKGLLKVFEMLGSENELAGKYRRLLARTLN